MLRAIAIVWIVLVTVRSSAAERSFDFGQVPLNETPRGFRSTVSGQGRSGEWKVVEDEVPSAMPALTPEKPLLTKRPVLAQLSRDGTDEHFPLLVFDEEIFGDFTLTTRLKIVSGAVEQMAGIAFRLQDERNYYYARASALGNTFRFFKLVNGERSAPIGPEVKIERGVWHDLTIDCKGNRIRCLLNGQELIPPLNDNSFSSGKIGFWTKSDSVAHFVDTKLTYTPRESLAQTLVRDFMQKYPRLVGLKIFMKSPQKMQTVLVASSNASDLGQPADSAARNVIASDAVYYGKEKQTATVTMPLHDRNGEAVGAVRILMKSFKGQTEQNALARALPIVKEMEARVRSAKDLVE
ncbi:MAG: DUF1080 domain-containing protein [Verrucomicrobiales bacterium]|nr:DUF1080 domain-containing protein [Verrucomicrobiales bacterium]